MIYGAIATMRCFAISAVMKHQSSSLRSNLVGVDARTWFVDGVLSISILLGFALAYFIEQTRFSAYAPLVDSILFIKDARLTG